jgi:hypothetical protein
LKTIVRPQWAPKILPGIPWQGERGALNILSFKLCDMSLHYATRRLLAVVFWSWRTIMGGVSDVNWLDPWTYAFWGVPLRNNEGIWGRDFLRAGRESKVDRMIWYSGHNVYN